MRDRDRHRQTCKQANDDRQGHRQTERRTDRQTKTTIKRKDVIPLEVSTLPHSLDVCRWTDHQ